MKNINVVNLETKLLDVLADDSVVPNGWAIVPEDMLGDVCASITQRGALWLDTDGALKCSGGAPTAAHDWDKKNGVWVLNETKKAELDAAARKAAVPHVVTMRQAKLALLQAGLLDEVDAAIAAEATPKAIKIEWEYASEVQRDWVNTLGLAEMLGLSDEQLDNLFVLAASL